MMLYSQFPLARSRQVAGDILALALIVLSIIVAVVVHSLVAGLAVVGTRLSGAGDGFRRSMSDAAGMLAGVPLIGKQIRSPFESASTSGRSLAEAGTTVERLVGILATVLAVLIVAAVIVIVTRYWGFRRISFARAATVAATLARTRGGEELLALRALTGHDPRALLDIDADPVSAWRRGDPAVVSALATVALRDAGIRPLARM